MNLDFNSMEEKEFVNFKGGEKSLWAKMFSDGKNRILHGRLTPGSTIGYHCHDTSSEIIFITKGTGSIKYDDTIEPLCEGVCHYCEKGHSHSLINNGDRDLEFLAVVPEQ